MSRGFSPIHEKFGAKLINKYAESYYMKEDENNQLKKTLKDLKTTLKFNKDMIITLTSNLDVDSKVKKTLENNKQEIAFLNSKIDSLNKEIIKYREKVSKFNVLIIIFHQSLYSENIALDNIYKEQTKLTTLHDRIFILDNTIIKKDNEIGLLKKKIKKL